MLIPLQPLNRFTCCFLYRVASSLLPSTGLFRCMRVTPNARAKMKGCLFSNNHDNSVITGPIALKLRMHEDIHLAMYFDVPQLGCYCTYTRARVVPRSRERLNRLRSNLVQRWGPANRVACKSQLGPTLHVRRCRVTVADSRTAGPIALKFGTRIGTG